MKELNLRIIPCNNGDFKLYVNDSYWGEDRLSEIIAYLIDELTELKEKASNYDTLP